MIVSSSATAFKLTCFVVFTVILFLLFAMPGALVALLMSLVLSVLTPRKPNMNWQQFQWHFHASWIVPCVALALAYVLGEILKDLGVFQILGQMRLLDTVWDRVSDAMLSKTSVSAARYNNIYFSGGWRNFYPAAGVGMLGGAFAYGVALFILSARNAVPLHKVPGPEFRYVMIGSFVFCVTMLLAMQYLEFLVVPGERGIRSRRLPLLVFVAAWPIALSAAVLCHALIAKETNSES